MTLLVIYIFITVCISFICSTLESVILSTSPAYIKVATNEGRKSGFILQQLKDNIDRSLAAILSVNTAANMVGATGVGAQVHSLYGSELVAIASGVLTLTILVFSEIIPKTLGVTYWKTLAPSCAYLIQALIFFTYPVVLLLEIISKSISNSESQSVTRQEVIVTAEMSSKEGAIDQKESLIIKNLLLLDMIYVSDIMTPRSVILAMEENTTVDQTIQKHRPIRFSRIPIYSEHLDQVTGQVLRYSIMDASSQDKHQTSLKQLKIPIKQVDEGISVANALRRFIQTKEHMFLVIDNQGNTTGIVTLEDAIETLLGVEIVDELDSVADLRQYALEKWQKQKKTQHSQKHEVKK